MVSWVNELQYFEYWNLRLAKPGHISTFILIDAVKHLYKCQNRKISNAVAWCISLKRALWLCSSRYISCTWCYIDDTPPATATETATATAWSIRFLLCKILFFPFKVGERERNGLIFRGYHAIMWCRKKMSHCQYFTHSPAHPLTHPLSHSLNHSPFTPCLPP